LHGILLLITRNRDSSVGIAPGYGLDGPGSIPGNARFSSSPQTSSPDWLWGPRSFLSKGYRWFFLLVGKAVGEWSWPLTSS
jgi:hypothetical protein